MALVPFTKWLPEVMPLVNGCPEPLAINAIRSASIDFCMQTLWWQDDYGPVAIDASMLPYDFVLPAGVALEQIMSGRIAERGYPLAITSIQELDNKVWNWRASTGEPRAIYQNKPGRVSLYPVPAGTDSYNLTFRIALNATRDGTQIEEDVYDYWLTDIAAGALEVLLGMENQGWANPGLAAKFGSTFKSAKVAAATQTAKSYGRQNQRVQMRHG